MKIRVASAARLELAAAAYWYDAQKPGLGDEFMDEYLQVEQRIQAFPLASPRVSRRSRRCRFDRFPYGVMYQIRDETIYIIAVMHLHRSPRRWRDREQEF